MPYKNPYFFVTTEPNRVGFLLEMQIISYSFVKAFQDQLTCSKDTDTESLIIIFGRQLVL